ncbi:hypothetical protein CDAR_19011 [Caerostris darwini]|uniref:Uncharacterized protein n=1 Tax=Caerostris darwini TaxID=1538125 RepID=A0AAV4WB86_9ARAC|nr:hypothetical protein CDAR_19011 [Caerostris darwini]
MFSKRKTPAERGRSTMNKIMFYSGGIMGIAGFGWLAHTAYRDATQRTAYAYMATASGLNLLFDFVREAWKNSAKPKLSYTIRKSGFETKSTEQKSDALFHKKINQFLQELDTGFGFLGNMIECIQCKKALDPEVTEEQDSYPKFEEMGLDKLYDLMFDLLGSYRKGEVYKDSLAAYDNICNENKEEVKKEIARFIEEYKQQVKLLFLPDPPVGNEEPLPAMSFPIEAKASEALYCCISDIADSAKEKLDKQIDEFLNKMREIEVQAIKTDYHGQLLAAMEILDGKSLFELCLLEKIKSSDQKTANWEEVLAEMEHFRRPLHKIEAIPLDLTTSQKSSIKKFTPFFEKYDKFVKTEYGKDFGSPKKSED